MTQSTPCSEDKGLFITAFSQFVVDAVGAVRQQWWQSCDTFPELGEPVPLSIQQENELAANRLIDTVSAALCTYPEQAAERLPWRRLLFQEIDSFVANHMGWSKSLRDLALSPDFFKMTGDFSRSARGFARGMLIEDLYQALRNVWIMMSFQVLFARDVELTDSVFAYSMLYPFTDNHLDSEHLSVAEKRILNARLARRLAGEPLASADEHEAAVFRLVARIEEQYPRPTYGNVYRSLLAINRAQGKSLMQQGHLGSHEALDVLGISIEKGGTSVLADGFLVCGNMDQAQAEFTFAYGVFLQFMDDLQDVQRDLAAKHMTLFSQSAASHALDPLLCRLTHFLDLTLAPAASFSGRSADSLLTLLGTNCRFTIMQAVAAQSRFFTTDFVYRLERFCPFRFSALNRLRTRQQRQYDKAKRVLAARGLDNAVFEFMGQEQS